MSAIFLTLKTGEDYNVGPVDLKFTTQYIDVSGGHFFYVPNPNPAPRQSTVDYVFHAGDPGYGHFVGYLANFEEYQPYFVTITDDNGVAPPQHAPTAQADTISASPGDASLPLTQFIQNDADPDGDLLYMKIVSPFQFGGAPNVTGWVNVYDTDPTASGGDLHFTLSSRLETAVFNANTGEAVPYATVSFQYVAVDPYGNESAPVTATIKLGIAPGEPTYLAGSGQDDLLDRSSATNPWFINAGAGNDTLRGGHGNDALNGGIGNDVISGGDGNDTITGGAGYDRILAGSGNDTFVINTGDLVDPRLTGQMDQILDFHGAGGYSPGENDFIRFQGMGQGSIAFDHNLGADPHLQIYNVFNGSGGYEGSLLIQMTDGVNHLAAGDFIFA